MSDLDGNGKEEGSGAKAGTDSTEKAVDKAIDNVKDKFVTKLDDDNTSWDDKYADVTITTEKPKDLPNNKASTDWHSRIKSAKKRDGKLPKKHTKAFKAGDPGAHDLCSEVQEDAGEKTVKVEKPFSKAKAINDVLENKLRKQIKDARCPAGCPNMRARIFFSVDLVVSSGDEVQYKVKWWIRIYCFDAADEDP